MLTIMRAGGAGFQRGPACNMLHWIKSLRELIEEHCHALLENLGSIACGILLLMSQLLMAQPNDAYSAARARLVETVLKGGGITNQRVLDAVGNTMRHEFVPTEFRKQAYYDKALPIGQSQTISSPIS